MYKTAYFFSLLYPGGSHISTFRGSMNLEGNFSSLSMLPQATFGICAIRVLVVTQNKTMAHNKTLKMCGLFLVVSMETKLRK
jgi:hypothetical protein